MSRIVLKAGALELELEGDFPVTPEFLELIFQKVGSLPSTADLSPRPKNSQESQPSSRTASSQLHVNSIASLLSANSGAEVAVAAASRLQIVEGKESFTRQEILAVIKSATKFYKANMSKNLSSILRSLTGSKINQINENSYSLTGAEFKSLSEKLAQPV